MTSQKHLFELPDDIHYLNGAYMSPLLKSVYDAGSEGMKQKLNPAGIHSEDFFTHAEEVKQRFGKLIHAPAQQIAIIPSASYGLAAAVNNIPTDTGNHAIAVGQEFPSDHYTIQQWCAKNNKELKVIEAPNLTVGRGAAWTEKILEAITPQTSAVILSTIHWADGTKYDLKKIGDQCKAVNARLIVDGTQSVGALPMDVTAFKIDALVCAAYKWLMGPYSFGFAYYSEVYNAGTPLEESWMNRSNAHDFTSLTRYVDNYTPGAGRYNMGEFSNPIHLPMVDRGLQQLETWGIDAIQDYCGHLIQPLLQYLQQHGYWFEASEYRSNHLFGFLLPGDSHKDKLLQELQKRKVIVSLRGDVIRVSPHVYNGQKDIQALIDALEKNKR